MTAIDEINVKHDQVRALLQKHNADGLMLRRTANIAWFTGGANASIFTATDMGAYTVLVTPDDRIVVTDNIEETRLRDEEQLEQLGFKYHVSPWHAAEPPSTPRMLTDDGDIAAELQQLRAVLTEAEQERLRALGRDAAAAIEEATRAVQPGDTEYDIAARLDAAVRRRGGFAVVNLVATDERISQYRHPLPTMKRLERYAMLVVCMRRHGLIVSATRLAHIGPIPPELQEKARKVATIDARVMAATRPGRTFAAIFDDLMGAYADVGEAGQWTYHHQGGLAGYAARERIATPGDTTVVQAGQMFAWNPSIAGYKSEDTILVRQDGFDIVTQASESWPMIDVTVGDLRVRRPGILELPS